jgi:hypothetical protein
VANNLLYNTSYSASICGNAAIIGQITEGMNLEISLTAECNSGTSISSTGVTGNVGIAIATTGDMSTTVN